MPEHLIITLVLPSIDGEAVQVSDMCRNTRSVSAPGRRRNGEAYTDPQMMRNVFTFRHLLW